MYRRGSGDSRLASLPRRPHPDVNGHVMRKLLYAGVVGPLLFIVVFLLEGFTRPGYSQWRHYVSQLATGDGGWMQVVNFLVCGTLVIAFAIALRETIKGTRGSIGGPVLIGLFGTAL